MKGPAENDGSFDGRIDRPGQRSCALRLDPIRAQFCGKGLVQASINFPTGKIDSFAGGRRFGRNNRDWPTCTETCLLGMLGLIRQK
jgi:hypothetical protein